MSTIQIQPQWREIKKWTALAKRHGLSFEAFDLTLLQTTENTEAFLQAQEVYRESGLASSLHGAFIDINPASGDAAMRRLSRARCEESCKTAQAIGADTVVFHGSCFPFLRGSFLEHWAEDCAEFYAALAQKYSLDICVENSMDLDPAPLRELMRRVQSDRVAVCLDIGHVNYSNAPAADWFAALEGKIRYLHISDNGGKFDEHLPLGSGTVDWKSVSDLWQAAGSVEKITLEVGAEAEASLAFLCENKLFGQR